MWKKHQISSFYFFIFFGTFLMWRNKKQKMWKSETLTLLRLPSSCWAKPSTETFTSFQHSYQQEALPGRHSVNFMCPCKTLTTRARVNACTRNTRFARVVMLPRSEPLGHSHCRRARKHRGASSMFHNQGTYGKSVKSCLLRSDFAS